MLQVSAAPGVADYLYVFLIRVWELLGQRVKVRGRERMVGGRVRTASGRVRTIGGRVRPEGNDDIIRYLQLLYLTQLLPQLLHCTPL